jgi:hypothetical protein
VVDPGENPRFRLLSRTSDGDVLDVSEGIIEVKLPAPPATLRGKPQIRGSGDGGAPTSFPLQGIILGGMHRLEGPVASFLEEKCLYMAQ